MPADSTKLPNDTTESMAVTLHIISGRGGGWSEERERDVFRNMARVLLDQRSYTARKLQEAWGSTEQPEDAPTVEEVADAMADTEAMMKWEADGLTRKDLEEMAALAVKILRPTSQANGATQP